MTAHPPPPSCQHKKPLGLDMQSHLCLLRCKFASGIDTSAQSATVSASCADGGRGRGVGGGGGGGDMPRLHVLPGVGAGVIIYAQIA